MNEDKKFPKIIDAEKKVIRTDGFQEERIPIYWGPDQEVREEGERYEEPKSWKKEFLRVPKVARFIYDEFRYDRIEFRPGPWDRVAGPYSSNPAPGTQPVFTEYYGRVSIDPTLMEYRLGFSPNGLGGDVNFNPPPGAAALLVVRRSGQQPPWGNVLQLSLYLGNGFPPNPNPAIVSNPFPLLWILTR